MSRRRQMLKIFEIYFIKGTKIGTVQSSKAASKNTFLHDLVALQSASPLRSIVHLHSVEIDSCGGSVSNRVHQAPHLFIRSPEHIKV